MTLLLLPAPPFSQGGQTLGPLPSPSRQPSWGRLGETPRFHSGAGVSPQPLSPRPPVTQESRPLASSTVCGAVRLLGFSHSLISVRA